MSENWAERQRNTNRLVRKLARYLFSQNSITAKHIYGLSKLSWITSSYDGDSAKYIRSTKIPALSDIFGIDFSKRNLKEISKTISSKIGDPSVYELLICHSGFTNFYKAYRNSSFAWIEENLDRLVPIYKAAYFSKTNNNRLEIAQLISKLPGIPKANNPAHLMKPEYLLTPVLFTLDPEIKFPIINGNDHVQNLLNKLKIAESGLVAQCKAMMSLYGTGGIFDAADLDQAGDDLIDFITTNDQTSPKKMLEEKDININSDLPLKDEKDVEVIIQAGTKKYRRIHNQLTNKLKASLPQFTLFEGNNDACMFDVLVKNYDNHSNDLLIEVKSSEEPAHIRMSIGQLFHYWYELNKEERPYHLAVLLPSYPGEEIHGFLKWLNIGLLWFDENYLCTNDNWLKIIITLKDT